MGSTQSSLPSGSVSGTKQVFSAQGDNYNLSVYSTTFNGSIQMYVIEFTEEVKSGNISVSDVLIPTPNNTYFSVMIANYVPDKGKPVLYGDVFGYNTSSTLMGQYKTMEKALNDVGAKYEHQHDNASLKRLGQDYKMLAVALDQIVHTLPESIRNMVISATVMEAFDFNWWACLSALSLLGWEAYGVAALAASCAASGVGCIAFAVAISFLPIPEVLAIYSACS